MGHSSDVPDIVILPPVLVGGVLVVGVVIHYALWTVTLLPTVLARVLGVAVFISAGVLAHFAQLAMKRAGTNILPTRPTLALATDGPYRFSRNPLYAAPIVSETKLALHEKDISLDAAQPKLQRS